jgi:hypothetical protein
MTLASASNLIWISAKKGESGPLSPKVPPPYISGEVAERGHTTFDVAASLRDRCHG